MATKAQPKQAIVSPIHAILAERGNNYGKFSSHAEVTQQLKSVLAGHHELLGCDPLVFSPDVQEALDMICHKIGRIVNGNPEYADSWRDIAGYATLVADRIDGVPQ